MKDRLREKADRAYCDMIDQSRRDECLGYAAKLKDGGFGEKELEAHCKMREFLGMHTAYADAAALASQPSDLRAKLEALRDYYKQDGDEVMVFSGGVVRWLTAILDGKG